MSNTYYTSMSGMLAASYGLQNTSNNVANMQSPGFKRNDVFYSSLGNGSGEEGLGSGVCIGGNATNFSDGNYLETSNPSDLAIVGQGFFVIRLKNGELRYTRDGEFEFNNDGILIDRHSGGEVQGYNNAGNLVPIHGKGPKNSPGKASHEIFLNGQFILQEKTDDEKNQPGPFKNNYKNIKFSVAKIYDKQGKAHEVQLEFESTPVLVNEGNTTINDNGTSWNLIKVTCTDADISPILGDQKIIFNGTSQGAKLENCSIHFTMNGDQEIKLQFGTFKDGADNSVQLKESKLNPEGTQIEAYQNDGYGEGKQISFSFDENGQISYNYDNGQTIQGIYIGLARFDELEHTLVQTHDSLFQAKNDRGTHIGRANKDGFGSIKAKQLESSNVDSTTEFANIVILQRMFQACSQIMDIDKQLLEDLESR
ncbi:flagellar hook-basal body complex protein [Legionella quateirensis]|uniref:Flagellar hook protein FlgE n=1 Tax=Legionella quateirensis TaxID=45072 RepID=A0A378KV16_9GAMM|nr:flagellar hook-basal body complex protein [Legionella quateirensis]KTD51322.1 flagellar hook protein FlgE [Legionella quateirensis]STY17431.1 flagellar hook protein FlgE [Legionella quateirensis]